MSGKLTPRQALFVSEYVVPVNGVFNGTRAAIAAGCPAASAHVTAARWLKNANVQTAVDAAKELRRKQLQKKAEGVLEELERLAFFDPGKLYDGNGERIPVHLLDEDTRRALVSIEDETLKAGEKVTRTQRVKMADKGQNLERLGRYHKLFTDKVEHDLHVTLEQLVCGDADGAGDAADR